MPPAQINYDGESREFRKSGGELYPMFLLAMMMLPAAGGAVRGFLHPFVIITTVPLAVAGAMLGLWM